MVQCAQCCEPVTKPVYFKTAAFHERCLPAVPMATGHPFVFTEGQFGSGHSSYQNRIGIGVRRHSKPADTGWRD